MDLDYGLYTLEDSLYFIPKVEGKWDNVVTNRAASEGNTMIDYLSYARRMLWIPQTDEKEAARKHLTETEQLANGCIQLADEINQNIPEYIRMQNLLAFYRILRGWSAGRYILRDEDDKLIPDIAIWDPRNTYWYSGRKGLTWVCYVSYAGEEEVKEEFNKWNGKASDSGDYAGLVKKHIIWGFREQDKGKEKPIAHEGVIINGEWVKEPEPSGLDYIPVRIGAGRSQPIITDGKQRDTMKNVGESYLVNNRKMLPIESRLLTYKIHRAGTEAKDPRTIEFDGSKSEGQPPPIEGNPYSKGSLVPLDTSKGQKLGDSLVPKSEGHIDSSLGAWLGLENSGGLPPLVQGLGPTPETAQATDMVFRAAMDKLKSFKIGMEEDYIWYAHETVRQFKNGDFGEYKIEGYDKGDNKFRTKIKPDNIDESWKFRCVLIPDELREKATKMGIADQAVKGGFMSPESASDQFQIVENPSLEKEKINRAMAEKLIPELALFEMSEAKLEDLGLTKADDKNRQKDKAIIENMLIRMKINQMMQSLTPQQPQTGSPNVEGIPRPMPPGAQTAATGSQANTARRAQPNIPQPIRDAAIRQQGGA